MVTDFESSFADSRMRVVGYDMTAAPRPSKVTKSPDSARDDLDRGRAARLLYRQRTHHRYGGPAPSAATEGTAEKLLINDGRHTPYGGKVGDTNPSGRPALPRDTRWEPTRARPVLRAYLAIARTMRQAQVEGAKVASSTTIGIGTPVERS